MAENNKKDSFNFPPVGGKNNKGPKFGGYWSFIIIAAFIIGIQFFSMPSNPERISWQKFKTDLLAKGEVKDIYIVRNGGKAEITLKGEFFRSASLDGRDDFESAPFENFL